MTKQEFEKKVSKIKVGEKVFFKNEESPMTVKSKSKRFMILTEPHYAKKTVYHSIIDFAERWRAPVSKLINPYDFKDQKDIDLCMHDLMIGSTTLSEKKGLALNIDWERTEEAKVEKK